MYNYHTLGMFLNGAKPIASFFIAHSLFMPGCAMESTNYLQVFSIAPPYQLATSVIGTVQIVRGDHAVSIPELYCSYGGGIE